VGKTTKIERSEAASYLRKAMQFLAEADTATAANRPDAAMLCAIHAAISAADAVTIGLSQLRSTDPTTQRQPTCSGLRGGAPRNSKRGPSS